MKSTIRANPACVSKGRLQLIATSSRGIRALRDRGVGTPAPAAPTEKLVVGGLYRYVRNPMYLAVAAVILGQAAVLGRWVLGVYALVFGVTVWSFVHWYEEPTLRAAVRVGV
jgi:protein-S-isoprenylcysteine O-methyltransferase Ste14